MCYFESKKLYMKDSRDKIFYRIVWDEKFLVEDAEALSKNDTIPQPGFIAECHYSNGAVESLASGLTIGAAQSIIDNHYGKKLRRAIWIKYCYAAQNNGKAYIIYLALNESNSKYMISVSRYNGKHIYPYCRVSQDDASDAKALNGDNLLVAIMDIAQHDIAAGVVERYFDEQNSFILDEYIADVTRSLFKNIYYDKEMRATSDPITYLCFELIKDSSGTSAFPIYQTEGEISLLFRGHIDDDQYEITVKLRLENKKWRLAKESISKNNKYYYARTLHADGGYIVSKNHEEWSDYPSPVDHSQLKSHLPPPIIEWLNHIK